MNEVKLVARVKKVQDVIKHVSRDFGSVDRGAIVTLEIPGISEGDLRRLQRCVLNEHVVVAGLSSPQLELREDGDDEVENLVDQGFSIGQEVVVLKTGELGTVNDTSPGGVLVKLGGEDSGGDLVPLAIHEVKLR